MSSPSNRLKQLIAGVSPPPSSLGTLKLGDITYDVLSSNDPSRLPRLGTHLLDVQDAFTRDNLHFLLQKHVLGQDVFLVSQPGPYARRLALTFCRLINAEYEYIALHRDVGETELKQGCEMRPGGTLEYVDSAAVRAAKFGRILILEGIQKAERGIMPLLNNLLENREMNLEDGTHILHPHRYALLDPKTMDPNITFIPAHKNFRVIAIGAPVPPYTGYPLDPPFRSRFQARFIDSVGSMVTLASPIQSPSTFSPLEQKLRALILSAQYVADSKDALSALATSKSGSARLAFPQTALAKLAALFFAFPPPQSLSPFELARLMLTLHPELLHAQFSVWALLSQQTEDAGLGALGSPSDVEDDDAGADVGLLGYKLAQIERTAEREANIRFAHANGTEVVRRVAAGVLPFRAFPLILDESLRPTPRFLGLLTCMMQGHALGMDLTFVPPMLASASCSTTLLVRIFGELLGYERIAVHMYKELGGRELTMRRHTEQGGVTTWQPAPLVQGAYAGSLVHLSELDTIGATAGSLARLCQDREMELWHNRRLIASGSDDGAISGDIQVIHPSLRIISTASKSLPLNDWLHAEHANMFFPLISLPMSSSEELSLLLSAGCPSEPAKALVSFAGAYRARMSADVVQKNRRLGTRALLRVARRLAMLPQDDAHAMVSRAVLTQFLPSIERMNVEELLAEHGIISRPVVFRPSPRVENHALVFPGSSSHLSSVENVAIPCFDVSQDTEGVSSHIPHMDHFYDNSLQTASMRDMAVDLELLGQHLVLLGNQGVGKNKIIDRLCQLLRRPREYMQLHRDSTVYQIMVQTTVESGTIHYADSPLLRAIKAGRVIVIDEADKAPEHVVAVFKSLASEGELSLPDGRRVVPTREREGDIVIHPNFRLVLLANRPGYPFLGNHFLQVLGDSFSCHAVINPDLESEKRLLAQLAPEIDEDFVLRLVGAFHDLTTAYESGALTYPYSLRELINLVRHLQVFPQDPLESALRNIFDFDVYKVETTEMLAEILRKHGLFAENIGLDAARKTEDRKVLDLSFNPKGPVDLDKPKYGKDDPQNEPHVGGNTWAGGTGGRDTAGLGGRGGYLRLFKGHNIHQVSDQLKNDVPDDVKERAREMARQELARRLQELDMSAGEARGYAALLGAVNSHIAPLYDLLENLAAQEQERVWVKRQTDGELDDTRLTEGIIGEAAVYKRRGVEKPEIGRPQMKPKRIRFVFDVSGSMYRFQADGRLQRSLQTAVMLMETFGRLSRKDKYVWDMYGHSGDSPVIPLVEWDAPPQEIKDRWKVVQKMDMITQYAFAGDYTVEAIEKAVAEVAKFDGDDWIVISITDANFSRYNITGDDLRKAMNKNPKVHTALIAIGEGAEAVWLPKALPSRAFRVSEPKDIPIIMRSILSNLVDRPTRF